MHAFSKTEQTLLKRVVDYYRQKLKDKPDALRYLQDRGLTHPDLLTNFQIGFCDRTLSKILPGAKTKEGQKTRAGLKALGLYTKKDYELFSGCLTFPILDLNDDVCGIYGRRIKKDHRLESHININNPNPQQIVFNPCAFLGTELILCEALIDALSFWVHDFLNVTFFSGSEGLSEEITTQFEKSTLKKVWIAFDNDKQGNQAALKVARQLQELKINSLRIKLPGGLDINEVMLLEKNPQKRPALLKQLIKKATLIKGCQTAAGDKPTVKTAQSADENQPVIKGEAIYISLENRKYRILGLYKNLSFEVMRINLKVTSDDFFYLDTIDLYQAKARLQFIKAVITEPGLDEKTIKSDLGQILLKLEKIQSEHIENRLHPKPVVVTLSASEEKEARHFLKSENLLAQISKDFETLGLIGESENALLGYLAMTSRKLEKPLAVMIQSSSSAGKSTLMDTVLKLLPPEDLIRFTAMTGQSLFYMGENDLVHKTLAISEEEGVMRAAYAIKTIQSERCLKIASTGKDSKSGRLETQNYQVNGPVQIFMTTTNADLDEELENRCFVLSVNESRAQTKAIHQSQRTLESLEGLKIKKQREGLRQLHQNAQRLLKPVRVVNPFAGGLTFPNHRLRLRRDFDKYLTLIKTITFLHQYQKEEKTLMDQGENITYIEVDKSDIQKANQLFPLILQRSLEELSPQTKTLLELIAAMIKKSAQNEGVAFSNIRFTRKELREETGWGDSNLKKHLRKLETFEYLIAYKRNVNQPYEYELLDSGPEKNRNLLPDSEICISGVDSVSGLSDGSASTEAVFWETEKAEKHEESKESKEFEEAEESEETEEAEKHEESEETEEEMLSLEDYLIVDSD